MRSTVAAADRMSSSSKVARDISVPSGLSLPVAGFARIRAASDRPSEVLRLRLHRQVSDSVLLPGLGVLRRIAHMVPRHLHGGEQVGQS
jgi:hypothetical protein